MTEAPFRLKGSGMAVLDLPPPLSRDVCSFFAFSLPMAGSGLVETALSDLCGLMNIRHFTPLSALFERGFNVADVEIDLDRAFPQHGYCFGGFRESPSYLPPAFMAGRPAALLVRDPGEALRAQYQSLAFDHVLPGGAAAHQAFLEQRRRIRAMGVDAFVLDELPRFEAVMSRMLHHLKAADLRVYRYEDIIGRKREWLADMAAHFGLNASDDVLDQVVRALEGEGDDDAPPLSAATRSMVDRTLSPRWRTLGYPCHGPGPSVAVSPPILSAILPPLPFGDGRMVPFRHIQSGEPILDVPPPTGANVPSFFTFSLPKAGSSLLEAMIRDICDQTGIRHFSPLVDLFERGCDPSEVEVDPAVAFPETGYCFTGFREAPTILPPKALRNRPAVLLVRDPRDALTSMYFSMAFSHPAPGGDVARLKFLQRRDEIRAMGLDAFVLNELPHFESLMDRMLFYVGGMNFRLYRYEDIIYRKREWLADMLAHFGLSVSDEVLERTVERHDIRPDSENRNLHVRQVHPGDGRRKLKPETLATLDAVLTERWRALGYPHTGASESIALPAALIDTGQPPPLAGIAIEEVTETPAETWAARSMPIAEDAVLYPPRRARFLACWMETADGAPVTALPPGDSVLHLCYVAEIGHVEDDLLFGFRVAEEGGEVLVGANSDMVGFHVGRHPPGTVLKVRWIIPFSAPAGRYRISCGCSLSAKPTTFLARHLDAFAFEVREP